ncbi:hypothetical protein PIROE2DRAFT_62958 [Piromyces sp. E2]|nr:hypothetical protein PIROE2DRAFT_62958 [Piromyces sp. E2]|eukprot:OUM60744.1 hypothetical protein PIROE2DRAFT_62958 [Piromyces sp. E2]
MNNSEDEKEVPEDDNEELLIENEVDNVDNEEDNEEINEEDEDNEENIGEEEEEEIDLTGSDDEQDENDTTDRYQLHFNEKVSEDISVYAAQIKKRIQESFVNTNKTFLKKVESEESGETFTDLQKSLFPYINNYNDILYSNSDNNKMDEIRSLYTLHSLNHVFKTRDKILKNTERIKHLQEKGEDIPAKYLCQNLIFTEYLTPELNSLFNTYCKNISGKIKIRHQHYGTINDVIIPVQQTYHRIATKSIKQADDDRFNFFIYKVLPSIQKSVILQMHTAIYVPSYFDFIRIRNYMDENDYSYHVLSEYTEPSDISRARSDFYHGRKVYNNA